MHILLTSSHGFVGSRIAPLLLAKGHTLSGLVRSDAAASKLEAKGIKVVRATLEQPDEIAKAAKDAEAVIHTAFDHDFSKYAENCEKDYRVVSAILDVLEGTGKPFIYTSAVMQPYVNGPIKETDMSTEQMGPRAKTEILVVEAAKRGIKSMVIRLPPTVHGPDDGAFVPALIGIARQKGVSAYSPDADADWSAVHVKDAAEVFVAALERGKAGKIYHAVQDVSIPFQEIAEVIAEGVGVKPKGVSKEELGQYLGFFAYFAGKKTVASADITKKELGWDPKESGLIKDMKEGDYFANTDKKVLST